MNDKAVAAAKVDPSAQAVKVDPAAQVKVATDGNKPVVDVVATNGTKQIEAQKAVTVKQEQLLTESQYSIKLQQEQVALLGLSTQILSKIMENAGEGKDVTLDGRAIRSSLLNQARRNYGVARTA
jgi:multidrug efflux pump subunit AcrB